MDMQSTLPVKQLQLQYKYHSAIHEKNTQCTRADYKTTFDLEIIAFI